MTLSAADFPAYFEAVHGYEPFPWQTRLMRCVLDGGSDGHWPDVLAVPTGCGKTSTLDVALFALAVQPERFPRRIVMVIDRRVVVDQGARHAERIEKGLMKSANPVAREVADRLRALWGGKASASPIEVAVLRGGMPRDDAWAHRPDRPVLAMSTVDQVGSRLLFRGYGVSPKMASVHAGLLGHDTLFLLDEVHLSVPFAETLLALRNRWRGFWPDDRTGVPRLPDRWGVVRLSATPGAQQASDRIFQIEAGGEDDQHPHLRPRLQASKPAARQLVALKGKDEDAKRAAFAKACSDAASSMLAAEHAPRTIGVIVNRVATARAVAESLEALHEDKAEVYLLTGRMRPIDRDDLLQLIEPRIKAGRERRSDDRPLFIVATQCIEAGADFDFDGLVTECASLDALKQRFGRLDRLGRRHESDAVSPAIILARSDQVADNSDTDPVYGLALKATWKWLESLGSRCDFGIRHLPQPDEEKLANLIAPLSHAPILLPAHLDAWNQTHPHPEPDPDVSLWLHGPERGEPEVQIVWRADLSRDALEAALDTPPEDWIERLTACPPAPGEALAVPLSAARRWLREQPAEELADVPITIGDESLAPASAARRALAWAGDESKVVDGIRLRAGMTLVVPSTYGGIRARNWDPNCYAPVDENRGDLGERAQWERHGRATLRLNKKSLPPELLGGAEPPVAKDEDTTGELRQRFLDWKSGLVAPLPSPWSEIVKAFDHRPTIIVHSGGECTVIARGGSSRETVSSEDDGASLIGKAVSLSDHSRDVWHWAQLLTSTLHVPDPVRADLLLAAWLHDAGKADPRFQIWLSGGSAVRAALSDQLFAKSAQTARNWRASEMARQHAGYPSGYRHELLSVALVSKHLDWLKEAAHDPELVLHLIGSHHGWCRPFAPLVDPGEDLPVTVNMTDGPAGHHATFAAGTRHQLARLDSGVTDRFWILTERYGWWGLAWLEAILRLADHRASEHGEPDE